MDYFLKGGDGFLVPVKFMVVAKELTVATVLSKISLHTVKFVVFMTNSNMYPCMVIVDSDK